MRKKRMPIIIILLILIAGGSYLTIKESKKIVISQEVRDHISISDLSLHVDQLLENGFDNDGFRQEYNAYVYSYRCQPYILTAQLCIYPNTDERGALDSKPTIGCQRIEWSDDKWVDIYIDDPGTGKLRMWVDYDYSENGRVDSKLINTILLKLFTEYSIEDTKNS